MLTRYEGKVNHGVLLWTKIVQKLGREAAHSVKAMLCITRAVAMQMPHLEPLRSKQHALDPCLQKCISTYYIKSAWTYCVEEGGMPTLSSLLCNADTDIVFSTIGALFSTDNTTCQDFADLDLVEGNLARLVRAAMLWLDIERERREAAVVGRTEPLLRDVPAHHTALSTKRQGWRARD